MKQVARIPPRRAPFGDGTVLTREELRSTHELYRLKKDIVDLLAQHFGGHTTLNHLRVGNIIGLSSQYESRPVSNHEIAKALGISRATVSRIVADFIRCGWVRETPHPEDGRRRLLVITPEHEHADKFEREFRRLVNNLIDGYEAGTIVKVDPDKRSF
jgi:DNA-binding MarR family transcriptional regulator